MNPFFNPESDYNENNKTIGVFGCIIFRKRAIFCQTDVRRVKMSSYVSDFYEISLQHWSHVSEQNETDLS